MTLADNMKLFSRQFFLLFLPKQGDKAAKTQRAVENERQQSDGNQEKFTEKRTKKRTGIKQTDDDD